MPCWAETRSRAALRISRMIVCSTRRFATRARRSSSWALETPRRPTVLGIGIERIPRAANWSAASEVK